jgi:hypothetical protein
MPTGKPMITWRKVALQYGCTRCGAPPGSPCRTDHGSRKYEIHQDRTDAARAHGWRELDDPQRPVHRT